VILLISLNNIKTLLNALEIKFAKKDELKSKISSLSAQISDSVNNLKTNFNDKYSTQKALQDIAFVNLTGGKTNFSYMFRNYTGTYIPRLSTGSGNNFESMFYNCKSLKTVEGLSTVYNKTLYLQSMFYNNLSLETIYFSIGNGHISNMYYTFYNCQSLKNVYLGYEGVDASVDFSYSPLLTSNSINNIIYALKNGATGCTLTLHSDVKNKLTEAQIAEIHNKGWTLA